MDLIDVEEDTINEVLDPFSAMVKYFRFALVTPNREPFGPQRDYC